MAYKSQKKLSNISISKGIGIILMVIGHIFVCSDYMIVHNFIYAFHMPLFFMISGYCFSERHLENLGGYVKRKMFSLYYPYVFWLVLFVILHNFLIDINIYDINNLWGCYSYYTEDSLIKQIYNIVFYLDGKEILVGQLWFVRTLFFVSLFGFFVIKYFISHLQTIILLSLCLSPLICYINFDKLPYLHLNNWIFYGLTMFLLGYYFKISNKQFNNTFMVLLSMIIISLVALFQPVTHPYYRNIYLYICTSILGFISILTISNKLANRNIGKIFKYLGDRTMPILILHFIFFRITTWCIIITRNDNISLLSNHPLPKAYANNYWYIYIIFGIALPILTYRMYLAIKGSILLMKNSHITNLKIF